MITPTQQIVCSIVSRQLVADQSPTSCRPVATHFQSVGNQSPTSRRPVADFWDSCRRPVADWSATEKCSFWSHSGCIGCSCFLVARQSPTGCSTCVTGALQGPMEEQCLYWMVLPCINRGKSPILNHLRRWHDIIKTMRHVTCQMFAFGKWVTSCSDDEYV